MVGSTEHEMTLDIITAALIVVPMGIGIWKGFLYTVVRLLGWAGALAVGFITAPVTRDLLGKSFIGHRLHDSLVERFTATADGMTGATDGLPSILGDAIDQTVNNTAELMATALEGLILTVMGFVFVVVLARVLLIFVIRPISKLRGNSPVSLANKALGMGVGAIEGLLLAFLFLAALIPVMQMSSPQTAAAIADALKHSHLAGSLYDGNLLVAIFG